VTDWSGRDYAEVRQAATCHGDRVLDGSTAWTGRLPEQDRGEFVADQVQA
jgi:hypothetical protein